MTLDEFKALQILVGDRVEADTGKVRYTGRVTVVGHGRVAVKLDGHGAGAHRFFECGEIVRIIARGRLPAAEKPREERPRGRLVGRRRGRRRPPDTPLPVIRCVVCGADNGVLDASLSPYERVQACLAPCTSCSHAPVDIDLYRLTLETL